MSPGRLRLGGEERPLEAPGDVWAPADSSESRGAAAQPLPHRALLSSRRPGPARAGVSGSRPRGGVTWRAGEGGEESLGALLSLPRDGARPAPASPSACPLTGPAGGPSAPHPLPGRRGAGRGRGGKGRYSFPTGPQHRAAAAPAPPSPSHPLPALSTCGGPGQEEAAHWPGRRQLSVRSPAERGGERGEGRRGKGGGHSAPPAGESGVERQRKKRHRHSRRACVLARGGPAPFRPALRRRSQVLAPPPARRPSVEAGRWCHQYADLGEGWGGGRSRAPARAHALEKVTKSLKVTGPKSFTVSLFKAVNYLTFTKDKWITRMHKSKILSLHSSSLVTCRSLYIKLAGKIRKESLSTSQKKSGGL